MCIMMMSLHMLIVPTPTYTHTYLQISNGHQQEYNHRREFDRSILIYIFFFTSRFTNFCRMFIVTAIVYTRENSFLTHRNFLFFFFCDLFLFTHLVCRAARRFSRYTICFLLQYFLLPYAMPSLD